MSYSEQSRHAVAGFGLDLRVDHYDELLAGPACVNFLEVLIEDHLVPGGRPLHFLDRFRQRYLLVMQGVSSRIVVWRRDFRVYHRRLSRDEKEALLAAVGGSSVSDICAQLATRRSPQSSAARAASLMYQWIVDHWIERLEINVARCVEPAVFATG